MKYCVVKGCSNSDCSQKIKSKKHVALFLFPKNLELKNKWKEAICNLNSQSLVIKPYSAVCEEHFIDSNFNRIGLSALRLCSGSVPSIFPISNDTSMPKEEIIDISYETNTVSSEIQIKESTTEDSPKSTQNEIETKCFTRLDIPTTSAQTTSILRYSGDITEAELKYMSQSSIIKCIRILKQKYYNQQKVIKRLRLQTHNQKKSIIRFKKLLTHLIKRTSRTTAT